ncbi:MAG TPA: hypothetical protein VGD02_05515, partial [Gemmatimonadaceae bacterium]
MSIRSLFSSRTLRNGAKVAAAIGAFALVSACASDQPGATGPSSIGDGSPGGGPAAILASPAWQETARNLVAAGNLNTLAAGRAYPLLGVAQYIAVQRVQVAQSTISKPSDADRGAVAGASVAVLSYLFPTKRAMLEEVMNEQLHTIAQSHASFATGEAIGRAVGAEMVARAAVDGFSTANTAIAPLGPGFWTSSTAPATLTAGGQLPGMMRWFLTSANQFRPAPPPVFGSAEFNAALTEVRRMSDNRTEQQIQIATAWALNPGTETPPGFWLEQASKEVLAHQLNERQATHVFALVSST